MDTYIKTNGDWKILSSQTFEIPAQSPAIALDSSILKSYCGVFELTKDITYTVKLVNDTLRGQRTGRPQENLIPISSDTFYKEGVIRGVKIFAKDSAGKIVKIIDRRNGQDLTWRKIQ